MTDYFTADLHLGHEKVAQKRGFGSVGEHDTVILDALSVLEEADTLYLLGDYALRDHFEHLNRIANATRAEIHLIPGNHDPEHPMHRRSHLAQRDTLWLVSSIQAYATKRMNGGQVLMSHLPYLGGGDHLEGPERHQQYRLTDLGLPLLCGHVHGAWREKGRMLNVGVDVWDLKPVHEREVYAWLKAL